MTSEVGRETQRTVRDEMLHAAVGLLHEHGPDALQTRKVASAAGTSTMAVYTHFGGMRGLIAELADEGYRQFDVALRVAETADPVADAFTLGIAYRRYAIEHPHMYRLMFGSTSAHGINAPTGNLLGLTIAEIERRIPSFAHVVHAVQRSARSGRIAVGPDADDTTVIATAAQFWALVHGFVMLELGGFYGDDGAAVVSVMDSMASKFFVALGDSPERVAQSRRAAHRA